MPIVYILVSLLYRIFDHAINNHEECLGGARRPRVTKMRTTLRMTLEKTYILSVPEYKSYHSFIQAYGHSPPVLP